MKATKMLLTATTCMAMAIGAVSCSESENEPNKEVRYMMPRTEKVQLTYKQKEMVKNHNAFAFELLRAAYDLQQSGKDKDKSFCLSPMGATYLLGMAGSGAEGETRKQIVDAMGMGTASAKDINDLCRTIIKDAPGTDKQVTLETANAVYANKDIALKEQFCKDMETYYEADARSLDFDSKESLTVINNWIKDKTGGKITDALDWLDPSATAYMANATYFRPTWTKHFDKENTKPENFTMEDGTTRQVQMMNNKARIFAYSSRKIEGSMVCLPFGSGTAWQMYIIKPNARENASLDFLVENLSTEAWEELMKLRIDAEMEIKIPKFSTTYMADMDKAMRKMGVTKVFTTSADLKGMCHNEVAYIRQMIQKSRIDVDEENAKTVATENGIEEVVPDKPADVKTEFFANRPFVYLICESSTNAVFFAGVYQGD